MSQPSPSTEWSATAASGARRALLLMAGLGLLAVLGVLVHRFQQPRWYYAQATIENLRLAEGWNGPLNALSLPSRSQPPLQILRKTEILYPVIDALDLTQVYARQGVRLTKQVAYMELLARMKLDVPSTQYAYVGVHDKDPAAAANIANTIAMTYVNKRNEDGRQRLERALLQYRDEAEMQRPLVRAAAAEAQQVRERDAVTDPDPDHAGSTVSGQATGVYLVMKAKYLQAKRLLDTAEAGLAETRAEQEPGEPAVRIGERAAPAARPIPWWRGDPRN